MIGTVPILYGFMLYDDRPRAKQPETTPRKEHQSAPHKKCQGGVPISRPIPPCLSNSRTSQKQLKCAIYIYLFILAGERRVVSLA